MNSVQTKLREKLMPYPFVKVKNKGQVTIPAYMREELHLEDGDFLQAVVKNHGVFFIPKTLIDKREIDEIFEHGMRDYHNGKGAGPFLSVKEFKR